jgi:hypothetical protein
VASQRWNGLAAAKNRKGEPYVEDRRESRRKVANGKTGFTSRKRRFDFFVESWTCIGTKSGGDGDCARRSDDLNRATEEASTLAGGFRK